MSSISPPMGAINPHSAPAGAAPLGIVARNLSPASQCPPAAPSGRSVVRFALQATARDLLPRERVSTCLRWRIPGRPLVDLFYSPAAAAAHYGGLQVCSSVWLCPVCAAKISERRRVELAQGLAAWSLAEAGGSRRVLMATFTLQHKLDDSLANVLRVLKRARSLLLNGKYAAAFRDKYSIVGQIRALEVTYGNNGWHVHYHVLIFFNGEPPIVPFTEEIKARWSKSLEKAGGYASWEHGVDVQFSDKDIADYIAKFGKEPKWTASHEMTKSVVKRGRNGGYTPLELLYSYMNGDSAAGRLWLQYACNFKGERQLFWSQGLRVLLGLEDEKTDEEVNKEQDEVAILLAQLNTEQWKYVIANDARGELLDIASSGDVVAVWSFLSSIGVVNGGLYASSS